MNKLSANNPNELISLIGNKLKESQEPYSSEKAIKKYKEKQQQKRDNLKNGNECTCSKRDIYNSKIYDDEVRGINSYMLCNNCNGIVWIEKKKKEFNICLNCFRHCCEVTKCKYLTKEMECSIYEERPEACKLFPFYFNPYKVKVEALRSCCQWQYFENEYNKLSEEDRKKFDERVINHIKEILKELE